LGREYSQLLQYHQTQSTTSILASDYEESSEQPAKSASLGHPLLIAVEDDTHNLIRKSKPCGGRKQPSHPEAKDKQIRQDGSRQVKSASSDLFGRVENAKEQHFLRTLITRRNTLFTCSDPTLSNCPHTVPSIILDHSSSRVGDKPGS
jgi:hypothetical protein